MENQKANSAIFYSKETYNPNTKEIKIVEESGKRYKVVNGTYYHEKSSDKVIMKLEQLRQNNTRIVLDYGNTETGESWNERFDVTGYIGRSTGASKIPILLYNKISIGGPAISDRCIVGIKLSNGKLPVYKWSKEDYEF